jgi:hypothetical protein
MTSRLICLCSLVVVAACSSVPPSASPDAAPDLAATDAGGADAADVAGAADAEATAADAADGGAPDLTATEATVRQRLGIPAQARTVILFGQNAHMDLDWQKTFDGYYSAYVEDILLAARALLDAQPRAFYSIAEMAFLQHHLQVHPEEKQALQAQAARGQLRIVGGGLSSPDTLLPETELLTRDFLLGVQLAEDTFGITPRAAWLPDSFGHSGTAPDLLAAAGFTSVAFSRVDGAPSIYQQLIDHHAMALPDSTAERLAGLGSADVLWRGPGGSTVLGHWLSGSGLYCQGDNLDYDEAIQVPGGHAGPFKGDVPGFTDRRVDGYLAELGPLARTPYRFVPVGCDFQTPKTRLIEYLDGYNQRRYPQTGAWAAAASFEDYATLVGEHAAALPVLDGEQADLTPYFQGFYGSRAAVKQGVRAALRPFVVAETFATALGSDGPPLLAPAAGDLALLARADHHDFVTGTSTDDVVATEQLPLVEQAGTSGAGAQAAVAAALAARLPATAGGVARLLVLNASGATRTEVVEATVDLPPAPPPDVHAAAEGQNVPLEVLPAAPGDTTTRVRLLVQDVPSFGWQAIDIMPGPPPAGPPPAPVTLTLTDAGGNPASGDAVTRITLDNGQVAARLERLPPPAPGGAAVPAGFALTQLTVAGQEQLGGPSLFAVDHHDEGGLWRTGNETPPCTFAELAPSAASPATTVTVLEQSPLLVRVAIDDGTTVRELALAAGAGGLEVAVTTTAVMPQTRIVRLFVARDGSGGGNVPVLECSQPAGYLTHPGQRLFDPTFFPAVEWTRAGALAVLLRQSTGVSLDAASDQLDLMAVRDARAERCDVEGGTGTDTDPHRIEWRLQPATSPADAARAAQAFNRPLAVMAVAGGVASGATLPLQGQLISADGDGLITALKPATRGTGLIVRALLLGSSLTLSAGPTLATLTWTATDLAERPPAVAAAGGSWPIALSRADHGALVTLRLGASSP